MNGSPGKLAREHAQLLVVDLQERLLPKIDQFESILARSCVMLEAARLLALPVTISQQYTEKLGATHPSIREGAVDAGQIEKLTFSVFADEAARRQLLARSRPQVILIGIETHVCVQQTALDIVRAGLSPVVLADAVGSRRPTDREVALQRMRSAGVTITTVESLIFELMYEAGTELFRKILPILK